MDKKKVIISAPYMHREKEKVVRMLDGLPLDVYWVPVVERLEENDLLEIIDGYEGIICGDDRITPKVIDKASALKTIIKWGTGIDSIDKKYAESKGVSVYRTADAFTEPVSDTTLAMMLAHVRSLFQNDLIVKNMKWDKPQGYTLAEKKIGIIGFGKIGQAVAKRLVPFGCEVLVNDLVEIDPIILEKLHVKQVEKNEIYSFCDIITTHCDLNETSFHLLNNESFKKMKKYPFIINTARGPIINEEDLIDAIENKIVSGAGLDVFEHEPLDNTSPLRSFDCVIASCHNSNSSPLKWDYVHKNSIDMLLEGLNG